VKFTQGQGKDVTIEEIHDQLWIRAQAWADEAANPIDANQVAAVWITDKGKFMQLVAGFICVSIMSQVVFLCMQYFYDVLNCDYLFIGNVPFCNMMDDVRKMIRSNVDNLIYVLAAQIVSVMYVAMAFASTTFYYHPDKPLNLATHR
jgi:hypothetical protein